MFDVSALQNEKLLLIAYARYNLPLDLEDQLPELVGAKTINNFALKYT